MSTEETIHKLSSIDHRKDWDDLSDREKIERMHDVVKGLQRHIYAQGRTIDKLRGHTHDTNTGELLIRLIGHDHEGQTAMNKGGYF